MVAVRDRDPRVGRAADGGADARNDLEGHARLRKLSRFLATAGENHRVTALQPRYDLPVLRVVDNDLVDLILRHGVILRALADVDFLAARLRPAQQLGAAQGVINEHVAGFDALLCAKGHETEIARPGADEITDSLGCHVSELKSSRATVIGSVPLASPMRGIPPSSGKTLANRRIVSPSR
jgi:hypothetical protein